MQTTVIPTSHPTHAPAPSHENRTVDWHRPYRPKFDLGYRPVPLNNYCRYRNRLVHHIFALVVRHINWATLDEDLAVYVKAHGGHLERGPAAKGHHRPVVYPPAPAPSDAARCQDP